MKKLNILRKNKIHHLSSIKVKNDVMYQESYMGEYYQKDFKYLSPEIKTGNKNKEEKLSCKMLSRIWANEIINGLKQFLYQGSLHGVKYIFEPTFSRQERSAWVLIILASLSLCTATIIQLFSKSKSTPFVNVIDSLPTPIWAIPFPSVVLCPQLHVKLSFANVSELDTLHQFFASRICPQMFSEFRDYGQKLTLDETKKLQKFIFEASPKCTDVVKRCNWGSKRTKWMTHECCSTYFKPLFTNYGLCYTFNGLPLTGMTNATIPWQETFNDPKTLFKGPIEWGLDTGYPKTFPPDPTKLPFRVMSSGEANGLWVELFLNTSEHQFACDGGSRGFNVLISSPTDHVYTSTVLRLPMERMTTIEVYPVTYKTDSTLRSLSPEVRQCFFQNERKLVFYEVYTDSNCKHDLVVQEALKACRCVLFNWPRLRLSDPVCATASEYQCIDNVSAKVEEQLLYAFYAESDEMNLSKNSLTSCHPSCNDIMYSSQVFYSDLIKDPGDFTPEWGQPIADEVTRINVHFYDTMFLGHHRHAQYDDYYFVGAIGGLLSLFLGFSIISVAELVYFILLKPLHAIVKHTLLFRK